MDVDDQGTPASPLEGPGARTDHKDVGPVRGWVKLLSGPTVVTGGLMVVALAAQTVLYRILPTADAGRLALVLSLVQTIALVGGLGQQTLVARTYSRKPVGTYDWRRDCLTTLGLTFPSLLVAAAAAAAINRLDLRLSIFVLAASWLLLVTGLIGSVLSSHQHYVWSAVLARLPGALLILTAGLSFFVAPGSRYPVALASLLVFGMADGVLALWLVGRLASRGSERIRPRQRLLGLLLLVSVLTVLLPDDGLISLAGGIVPPASIAGYASVLLLFGVFKLLFAVLILVLVTELARTSRPNYRSLTAVIWAGAMTLGLLSWAVVPPAVHVLYAGRYDWAATLVPWFALGGILQLTESLPLSHMVGRADERALNKFIFRQILVVASGVGLFYALVPALGIRGIAITATAVYVGRNILAYASMALTSKHSPVRAPG